MPKLYLIPSFLSESSWEEVLPEKIKSTCQSINYFIVENVRTSRRFLKKLDQSIDIDSLTFFDLNKRTSEEEKQEMIAPLKKGFDVGIISEAGCPGIADPGAEIVKLAHKNNYQVVPLVGPSSILLALMASGLNGQNFVFNGYLPIKPTERGKKIRFYENKAIFEKQSQIFIETPYRNNHLLNDIIKSCKESTMLCIAVDITSENEMISTKSIGNWRRNIPDINKRPTIFILGSGY